jgi:hypothetical protein
VDGAGAGSTAAKNASAGMIWPFLSVTVMFPCLYVAYVFFMQSRNMYQYNVHCWGKADSEISYKPVPIYILFHCGNSELRRVFTYGLAGLVLTSRILILYLFWNTTPETGITNFSDQIRVIN